MQKDKKSMEYPRRQQNILTAISALIFVLVIFGIGWVLFQPKASSTPQVLSLNENWEMLENGANGWQNNAYLTSVSFYLTKTMDPDALQVAAEFHSSHVPSDEMLLVGINNAGKVVSSPLDMMPGQAIEPEAGEIVVSAGSSAQKPIQQGEWSIDSQAALDLFAKDQEIGLCLGSSNSETTLILHKVYTDYPAWELRIAYCPDSTSFNSYYLNAKTGERFDPVNP
jgi:hypothetical protein